MLFSKPYHFPDGREGSSICVRVTPRCSRVEITGIMDDGTVKIKLRNAPIEDNANHELIKYLSMVFKVPQMNIKIIYGRSQRKKVIVIAGINPEQVREKILENSGIIIEKD